MTASAAGADSRAHAPQLIAHTTRLRRSDCGMSEKPGRPHRQSRRSETWRSRLSACIRPHRGARAPLDRALRRARRKHQSLSIDRSGLWARSPASRSKAQAPRQRSAACRSERERCSRGERPHSNAARWYRHPELVWELSSLHLHWLCAYDPDQHGSAPIGGTATSRRRSSGCTTGCPLQELALTAIGPRERPRGPAKPSRTLSMTSSSPTATRTSYSSSWTT